MSAHPVKNRNNIRHWLSHRFGFKCFYCSTTLTKAGTLSNKSATLDHKIPLSNGGKNDIHNLVLACRRCNQLKGRKTAGTYLRGNILKARLREFQTPTGAT